MATQLPTRDSIATCKDGYLSLTEEQYLALAEEASIAAAESGADREYDYDLDQFEMNWISNYLQTDEWSRGT
ncbi:hypothetical protein JCM19235_1321 [Vibrio maritimus]|uniref:Uncharacterized protein n=1 Tax=Vibrio maritimus TaxID=990268 RepID=A0A090S5Q0_9VIBR|nr:hypothetical protein JCM19235_1321 [Vibrio maritimus]